MSSLARVPAVLRGPETDSKCILEAWQESSSTGRVFTRCRITNEPADLPDGPYQLVFGKHAVKTWKCLGSWELVYLPPEAGTDLMLRSFELAS